MRGGGAVFRAVVCSMEITWTSAGPQVLHEVSRFERRGGRWVYVDGVVDP